jgi:hypothetical protein
MVRKDCLDFLFNQLSPKEKLIQRARHLWLRPFSRFTPMERLAKRRKSLLSKDVRKL